MAKSPPQTSFRAGAQGTFTCSRAIPKVTCAAAFAVTGKESEVFVRFSTVARSKGSPVQARDVRRFSMKFCSDEGNLDRVGNNMSVFFSQDVIKFSDQGHALKPAPDREFSQAQSAHDNGRDSPQWDLGVQVVDQAFADGFAFDVLDPAELIPEEDCPVDITGTIRMDLAASPRTQP